MNIQAGFCLSEDGSGEILPVPGNHCPKLHFTKQDFQQRGPGTPGSRFRSILLISITEYLALDRPTVQSGTVIAMGVDVADRAR